MPPTTDPIDPADILARTLWGEDRRGRELVANVIMNRVNADLGHDGKPDWWGEGVIGVCLKPFQLSCWLPGDPNRDKIRAVTTDDPIFVQCLEIAQAAIAGNLPDYSDGSTHYLNAKTTMQLQGKLPPWGGPKNWRLTHGHHDFYRVI